MNIRLHLYDWIVVSTSGGKDSQTMLRKVCRLAAAAGVLDRVVAVHADMGRVEWPGVPELAKEQADHYGVRFECVTRPQGDLLDHVRERSESLIKKERLTTPPVPSPTNRYCTSHHKSDQIDKVITRLTRTPPVPSPQNRYCTSDHKRDQIVKVIRALPGTGKRRVRILQCMGMRAKESTARGKMRPFSVDRRNSGSKRKGVWRWSRTRIVHKWLPIHDMTEAEVWADVKASGVRWHWAYDLGMPRLSCCFCIYAPKQALVLAARHMPDLAREYAKVEEEVGFSFRQELPMVEVIRIAESGEDLGPVPTWEM